MKLLICFIILAAVSLIYCHPAMDSKAVDGDMENGDPNSEINLNSNSDNELTRKPRSFCCRGGGFLGRRRPYFGGGGGGGRPYGGFGGSGSYSQSSSYSSSGSIGFGK